MVRATLSVTALLVVSVAVLAADQKNAPNNSGTTGDKQVVVVDPMDLRQPVPNPERELTEKYDGKQVRYTGQLHAVVQDKKTKAYSYELQTPVRSAKQQDKAKKDPKAKPDVVTVTVFLQKDDKRLQNPKAQFKLTVVGKGEIGVDGSLIIRNAQISDLEESVKRQ